MIARRLILAPLLILGACQRPGTPVNESENEVAPLVEAANEEAALDNASNTSNASVDEAVPPAPGTPGGLPEDRTPISEATFAETSAQGAANVVQTYYALVESGRYTDAYKFWSDGGRASGKSAADFADSFDAFKSYHANIGAPGDMEGAAGSSYVDVPVQLYGRKADGSQYHELRTATLRRVNDVPGSTAEQRKWHIVSIDPKGAK